MVIIISSCNLKEANYEYAIIEDINLTNLGLTNHKLVVKYSYNHNGTRIIDSETFYQKTRKAWFVKDTLIINVFKTDPVSSKIIGLKDREQKMIKSFQGSSRKDSIYESN